MLLANGHPTANLYPIWMVFAEARYVTQRNDAHLAAHISLMQMTLSSIPNMGIKAAATKKIAKALGEILKEMRNG